MSANRSEKNDMLKVDAISYEAASILDHISSRDFLGATCDTKMVSFAQEFHRLGIFHPHDGGHGWGIGVPGENHCTLANYSG